MTQESEPNRRWRYIVRIHVPGTEAAILRDALEGEPVGLATRLGEGELERQIRELEIDVDEVSDERWDDFARDLEIMSLYLTSNVEGIEIQIDDGPELRGFELIARRGEVVRLEVEVGWNAQEQSLVIGEEKLDALESQWSSLPDWIRTAMLAKHPELAERVGR